MARIRTLKTYLEDTQLIKETTSQNSKTLLRFQWKCARARAEQLKHATGSLGLDVEINAC
jgi:hypothetical protein